MKNYSLRKTIASKRGLLCEVCCLREWSELHHCLVHDNKRLHKQLTVEENLMAVCRECHPHLNGHEVRKRFLEIQLSRGYDILSWYNALDMNIKECWIVEMSGSDN